MLLFRSAAPKLAPYVALPGLAPKPAPAPGALRAIRLHGLRRDDLEWLPALAELLVDGVHHGASLGLLAPLSRDAALDFWRERLAGLGPQQRIWVATARGDARAPLLGAVELVLGAGADAHHRGELQRLMVHSQQRGLGLASQLVCRAECAALDAGRSLLVAQLAAGSQAEAVFAHLGWQRGGEIPELVCCAEGRRHTGALYYRRLALPR
ncbi:MAG: GNAT family N-acetyltransferase [Pelomonas sp.]|nr:GNAT family N-acetyltransferase [Roseateles sp.]